MSMLLPPGTLLDGRYEVLRCLGHGGMATVYLVKHSGLGSLHALKVLSPELTATPEVLKRFLSEGKIQAQLKHPNVVAVTELVTSPVAGLVMEYVEGGTLADWLSLHGRAKTKEELLELFLPVLDAVGEAHRQGVVHRDLKPENIILGRTPEGRPWPRVTDFGIARVAADGTRLTRTGARMGTLNFMSPEQLLGAESADLRSDIFSLGAILYELATGQRAFDGKTDLLVMKAIEAGKFTPPREVSPNVRDAIQRALKVAPEARFQSCAEFTTALTTSVPVRREWRPGWRLKAFAAWLGGFALLGLCGRPPDRPKMDRAEVTVDAYAECVREGACSVPGKGGSCNWGIGSKGLHPVNCVTWAQASDYCRFRGQRLPTEEEWEWEASNGGRTLYPWGDRLPDATLANWNGKGGTAPAWSYPSGATVDGIMGMAGNVWEWTSTSYDSANRVVRGGSWLSQYPVHLRSSNRSIAREMAPYDDIGFRCVR